MSSATSGVTGNKPAVFSGSVSNETCGTKRKRKDDRTSGLVDTISGEEESQLNLLELPVEVIQTILTHTDFETLNKVLLVSKALFFIGRDPYLYPRQLVAHVLNLALNSVMGLPDKNKSKALYKIVQALCAQKKLAEAEAVTKMIEVRSVEKSFALCDIAVLKADLGCGTEEDYLLWKVQIDEAALDTENEMTKLYQKLDSLISIARSLGPGKQEVALGVLREAKRNFDLFKEGEGDSTYSFKIEKVARKIQVKKVNDTSNLEPEWAVNLKLQQVKGLAKKGIKSAKERVLMDFEGPELALAFIKIANIQAKEDQEGAYKTLEDAWAYFQNIDPTPEDSIADGFLEKMALALVKVNSQDFWAVINRIQDNDIKMRAMADIISSLEYSEPALALGLIKEAMRSLDIQLIFLQPGDTAGFTKMRVHTYVLMQSLIAMTQIEEAKNMFIYMLQNNVFNIAHLYFLQLPEDEQVKNALIQAIDSSMAFDHISVRDHFRLKVRTLARIDFGLALQRVQDLNDEAKFIFYRELLIVLLEKSEVSEALKFVETYIPHAFEKCKAYALILETGIRAPESKVYKELSA